MACPVGIRQGIYAKAMIRAGTCTGVVLLDIVSIFNQMKQTMAQYSSSLIGAMHRENSLTNITDDRGMCCSILVE